MASHLTEKHSHSLIDQKRFAYLELMIIWEGSINARLIAKQFELNEKLADHVIQKYKNLFPNHLQYVAQTKSYVAHDEFVAQYTQGLLEDYVQLMSASHNISTLAMPSRRVLPNKVQPILHSIREQKRLRIEYASVSSPQFTERVIQPHNLVFDGMRWHVRAYCEKNGDYRDFVLSRFNPDACSDVLDNADHFDLEDESWMTMLEVEIMPDPRLDENRARLIAMDYDMTHTDQGYRKTLKVRAALLMYLLQRLGVMLFHSNPQAQQIIVSPESMARLKPYLPN